MAAKQVVTTVVDDKLKQYSNMQAEIQKIYEQKQQVLSQYNENSLVKGELDLLEEDAKVFKLVGPVLMTIEIDEAKQNVDKRLQFIEAELKKFDVSITAKQKEQTALGDEIAKIQQEMQAGAAAAAQQVAGLA